MEKIEITREGKIQFTSQAHAVEVQQKLLDHGYRFPYGVQEPRQCVGIMFRSGEIRSAANLHAWAAYNVRRVEEFEPYPVLTEAQELGMRAAQAWKDKQAVEVERLTGCALVALQKVELYHPELFSINKRLLRRPEAWRALIFAVMDIAKTARVGTMRKAVRAAMDTYKRKYSMPDNPVFTRNILEWNLQK